MGLLDILNGMQNGPHGTPTNAPAGKSGGMSPMMMALLGMLAYKAIKSGGLGNMLGGGQSPSSAPAPSAPQSGGGLGDILGGLMGGGKGSSGGGLGDILGGLGGGAAAGGLGGILGGLLGSGAAGGLLNGGLKNMLQDMEAGGQGDTAKSWVGNGPNQQISKGDLANALGADDINAVATQTGLSSDDILSQLSQHLPEFINKLTPDGRVPSDIEAHSRWAS